MTEIQTARLLLRPWQPDDLAEFTRLLTDPEVTRYIVVHTPFSPQDVAELSARTLEQWERNGFGPWACAPAKAPGHDPGPCCWPPPGQPDRRYGTVVPWGDNSTQFCAGPADSTADSRVGCLPATVAVHAVQLVRGPSAAQGEE